MFCGKPNSCPDYDLVAEFFPSKGSATFFHPHSSRREVVGTREDVQSAGIGFPTPVCLGLGTLVKVRERFWFQLSISKANALCLCVSLLRLIDQSMGRKIIGT